MVSSYLQLIEQRYGNHLNLVSGRTGHQLVHYEFDTNLGPTALRQTGNTPLPVHSTPTVEPTLRR